MQRLSYLTAKVCCCFFIASFLLYVNIDQKNEMTKLQLTIPKLEGEVKELQKEMERLCYEINQFESPLHLMELLRDPAFSHLTFPRNQEVVVLPVEQMD